MSTSVIPTADVCMVPLSEPLPTSESVSDIPFDTLNYRSIDDVCRTLFSTRSLSSPPSLPSRDNHYRLQISGSECFSSPSLNKTCSQDKYEEYASISVVLSHVLAPTKCLRIVCPEPTLRVFHGWARINWTEEPPGSLFMIDEPSFDENMCLSIAPSNWYYGNMANVVCRTIAPTAPLHGSLLLRKPDIPLRRSVYESRFLFSPPRNITVRHDNFEGFAFNPTSRLPAFQICWKLGCCAVLILQNFYGRVIKEWIDKPPGWSNLLLLRGPVQCLFFYSIFDDKHFYHVALFVRVHGLVLCFCTGFGIFRTPIFGFGNGCLKMLYPCCNFGSIILCTNFNFWGYPWALFTIQSLIEYGMIEMHSPKFYVARPVGGYLVPHLVKDQFFGVSCCISSLPPWPEAILLGFRHYIEMLSTSVSIFSFLVPQMGRGKDKVLMIQLLQFVAGMNTLAQTLLGTRQPAVIGGSYTFVPATLSIIFAGQYSDILDPQEKFKKIMAVASTLQIDIGFSGLWRNVMRLMSPHSTTLLIALTGFGLFELGLPLLTKGLEIVLPQLVLLIISSQYLPHLVKDRENGFDQLMKFPSMHLVLKIWSNRSMSKDGESLGDSSKMNNSDEQNFYFVCSNRSKEPLNINIATFEYMTNGSLDHCLRSRTGILSILDRSKRYKVTLCSTRDMVVMYQDFIPQIIHCNIKASNILFDEEFESKVDDIGLVRLINACETNVSTDVAGMFAYIPPEYGHSWKSTTRGAVYIFGVISLEFSIGKEPTRVKRGYVASSSKEDPVKKAANFTFQVIILNHLGQIRDGYAPVLDHHTFHIAVKFAELLTKIDRCSSRELENEPKFLKNGDAVMIKNIEGWNLVGWVLLKSKNCRVVDVLDLANFDAGYKPMMLKKLQIVMCVPLLHLSNFQIPDLAEKSTKRYSSMVVKLRDFHHLEDKVNFVGEGNDTPTSLEAHTSTNVEVFLLQQPKRKRDQ